MSRNLEPGQRVVVDTTSTGGSRVEYKVTAQFGGDPFDGVGSSYSLSLCTEEPTRDDQHEVSGGNYARILLTAPDAEFPIWSREPQRFTWGTVCDGVEYRCAVSLPDEAEGMLLTDLLSPATLEYVERVKNDGSSRRVERSTRSV